MFCLGVVDNKGKAEQQLVDACDKMAGAYPVFKLKQLFKYVKGFVKYDAKRPRKSDTHLQCPS